VDIHFGQSVDYENHTLKHVKVADTTYWSTDPTKSFAVINMPQSFHLGVQQLVTGDQFVNIFVDPYVANLNGTTEVSIDDTVRPPFFFTSHLTYMSGKAQTNL